MEPKYLIDTNILIYYLSGDIPESQLSKINKILENSFCISTITKIEILGWHKIPQTEKRRIENFIGNAQVIYIDKDIENKAIDLKQNRKIAIPDAVIAATAVLNNYTLITRNVTDFEMIENINIYNPF
jgi:toxin FitB